MENKNIAVPTPLQLLWQEQELGVLIHYIMDIYDPSLTAAEIKSSKVRSALSPEKINPENLDPEQWVRSAWKAGAKYAVLVANHCTGFSLWQTKVNDYCTRSLAWKNGKGDIVAEFIAACKKYGLRPGIYYSTAVNGYYDINDEKPQDYSAPYYKEYVRNVEAQLTELWSGYGELFEIWFDGGIIPAEKGGPDVLSLLKKYQPNALCFQGPEGYPHNLRWVGNEEGLAPENCWATTDGEQDNITRENINFIAGNPYGKYYAPAETDTPNRSTGSFGGGWAWKEGQEALVRSPEELLDCYIKSVGRNSNLLLGMAIGTNGQFEDEEQFEKFGAILKETFGKDAVKASEKNIEKDCVTLTMPSDKSGRFLVLREKTDNGQRILGFRVCIDGKPVYEGACIGHKRIIPLDIPTGASVTVEITESLDGKSLRDVEVY